MVESTQIEAARQTCPRMGFCSDDDNKKMMSDFKGNLSSASHLFDAKCSFIVKDDMIHGLECDQGESLYFNPTVKIEAIPETINAAVAESHKAMRREIEKAMGINGDSLALLKSDCINQAIEVVDMIRNTRDTEEVADKGPEAIKEYLDKLNAKLEMLSKETRNDMLKCKRVLLTVMITLNVNHRNMVKDIYARVVEIGKNGFNELWLQQLRHYWEDGVKVRCDAYELNYGYEYQGVLEKLVVTPLTRKAYAAYARGMYQGSGVVAAGPAGTGKTETAKDFYKHCGRRVVVINCSDQLTAEAYGSILEFADKSDNCVCFDEFNRTTPAILEQAQPAFAKHANKKQSGVTLTFNPGYMGRSFVPMKYYEDYSKLTMVYPDYPLIYQVMMHNEGLGLAADDLTHPFINSMNSLKAKCSKAPQYDFGLRCGKSLTRHIGALNRVGAAPADSVVTAFDANFSSMMTKEDKAVFDAVMAENFPGAKVCPMDSDFAAKFASAHPDASDFTKQRAQQIYSKSQIRHSLWVMGTESKIIEDVVGVLGGSCSVIEPEMDDLNTFYNINMKAEFLKGASCDCHWLIIKEKSDTIWAIAYELMNSVTDDNKKLNLSTNEIVPLPASMRIVLLATKTETMTPAMISRHGVINMTQ